MLQSFECIVFTTDVNFMVKDQFITERGKMDPYNVVRLANIWYFLCVLFIVSSYRIDIILLHAMIEYFYLLSI